MTEKKQPTETKPAVQEKNITDAVLARINDFKNSGALKLPADYSAENALKSAYLVLQDVKTRDGKPVLETCQKTSIVNALLKMVVYGLSPMKKQCYFIPYGDKLSCDTSYFGDIATARRVGLKDVVSNIIFEGDEFEYSFDPQTGRHKIEKHVQKIENIDITKIRGGYAVFEMENGARDVAIMTIKQIRQSWLQGATKGNSPAHNNFTDEMAKRTLIRRACKQIINSSDDSYLFDTVEQHDDTAPGQQGANAQDLSFTEAEVIPENDHKPEPLTDPEPKEKEKELELTGTETKKGPGF